jgi:glycosyltransferase involved in cell wall biosynthesis
MHLFAKSQQTVQLVQVNTAVRWRRIDDLAIWKRVLGGGLQLLLNLAALIHALFKKIDIIHLTTSGGIGIIRDLMVLTTVRIFHFPAVYHIRFGRIPEIALKKTFEWKLFVIALHLANVIIAIDKPTSDVITNRFPKIDIKLLPNPIDFSKLPASEKEDAKKSCVLFLGWVVPSKGIEELVDAWSALSPKDWILLLVGPGNQGYRQKLIDRYRPKNLKFLEEVTHNEAMQLLAKSDIFILPSYSEGFPNVILEAMAMSKPIIASSVGAIPEMLAEECGTLIEPRNVSAIKNALSILIQDESLRSKLAINARRKAQKQYSIDVIFDVYMRIWQTLVVH